MKGFRSLENGSRVSFSTRPGKKGIEVSEGCREIYNYYILKAYNVRGETDTDELTGSSVRPLGKKKNSLIRYDIFYHSTFLGSPIYLHSNVVVINKYMGDVLRCFKCGGYGNHVAAKCRKIQSDNKVIA